MTEENIKFIWQHKYNNKWKNYSMDEHHLLNKAATKSQKTVTLPSTDSKKKIIVNLEKMLHKNAISGFEQEVRCLIYNGGYIFWSWEEDNNWISYPARITFSLEVAFSKNLDEINVFNKVDYQINFRNMTQVNVRTNYVRPVSREMVVLSDKDYKNYLQLFKYSVASEKTVQERVEDTSSRSCDIIFNLPSTNASFVRPTDIVEDSHHENIVQALSAEVASSSSGHFSGRNLDIPVDVACPEADSYHIYCENNDVYKVTLNLTNLQENNNKYFIIELLKSRKKNLYSTWFHWGRTGYNGQNNLVNYGSNLAEAKLAFENKFYDKTHNRWENRDNFVRKLSKYDLVFTDFTADASVPDIREEESKLHEKIQNILKIICDKKRLEEAAKEFSYDSNKTPLGKITAKQILDGYTALDNISNVLKSQSSGKALIDACNKFYTKIPHNFGRQTPPLLSSLEDVKEKLKMLEALSNIVLAMDMLNSQSGHENVLDKYYKSLECNLIPLDHSSEEFITLRQCLVGTHGSTHNTYTMELVDAFLCNKVKHESSFISYRNKKLLWHGSRISNWIGILKKGLQIAPPEAPSTGYMFGKGIYFADVSSKSANYCLPTKKKNEGLLLLSEVSLGDPFTVRDAVNLSRPPVGYNSVFGSGKIRPSSFETTVLSPDAVVSKGPLEEDVSDQFSLYYNEYVVYNVHQVKMKYVLRVKFNF